MSATLIYGMRCGCEFWERLDAHGRVFPDMQYCKAHEAEPNENELSSLRSRLAELEAAIREALDELHRPDGISAVYVLETALMAHPLTPIAGMDKRQG